MKKTLVQLLLVPAAVSFASLAGCAHSDVPPPAVAQSEYRIGREDLVDVQVWKEPALSATVPVRPDGKISLPMAGDVMAQGKSTDELQKEIVEKLKPFVPQPSVTVMVKELKANRFYVLGEVAHPGAYPIQGPLTILEAMAVAGGPTEFARTSRLVVIRPPQNAKDKPTRIKVNLGEVVDGDVQAVHLTPGDTVYVP